MSQKVIEWNSSEKECTHINYVKMGKVWYLVVGYVGHFEVYNEDGTKQYYNTNSSDYDTHESPFMNACFLSSCVVENTSSSCFQLFAGTSLGEVYKFTVTASNSVIFESKFDYSTLHPITSLAGCTEQQTVIAGTALDHKLLLNIGLRSDPVTIAESKMSRLPQLVVVTARVGGFFVTGHQNGLIQIFTCNSLELVAEI